MFSLPLPRNACLLLWNFTDINKSAFHVTFSQFCAVCHQDDSTYPETPQYIAFWFPPLYFLSQIQIFYHNFYLRHPESTQNAVTWGAVTCIVLCGPKLRWPYSSWRPSANIGLYCTCFIHPCVTYQRELHCCRRAPTFWTSRSPAGEPRGKPGGSRVTDRLLCRQVSLRAWRGQ